ncbi:MAG: hypothetical protein EXS68_02750 [Candidatus Ryanbacteria bacterium]|nr:hypothetical protein [Candidatus Ryanbacteria bacterium]
MEKKNLWAIVGLLVVLFLALWVALSGSTNSGGVAQLPTMDATYIPEGPLAVTHSVDGMTHTYSGKLTLPACNTLATGITTSGNNPVSITLALRVITSDPVCADKQPVEQPFSVSFTPVAKTAVAFESVTLNSTKTTFTLIEPAKK